MDALAQRERDKYTKVYETGLYGIMSPGFQVAKHALRALGAVAGESIIDYGCGTGKALRYFRDWGLEAKGVDIVNATPNEPVVLATLWDLPPFLSASDWCFCCDVLEHLPEEKLDDALAQMAQRTRKGGFLQPAMKPDVAGPKLIGEPLHLTVRPREWWLETIGRHFSDVYETEGCGRDWQLSLIVRKRPQ